MRLEKVVLERLRIPFRSGFRHALKERRVADAIVVVLQDERGTVGLGEILPRPYLTGETLETVLDRHAPALAETWLDARFDDPLQVVDWLGERLEESGRALATHGGFELAILDLVGRRTGRPVHRLLGWTPGPELPPGVVIGFEVASERLARHCALLRLMGKRHVKVKVGLEDDEQRLEILFGALGDHALIRLDANGAWSAEEAIEKLSRWRRFPFRSVEQPVAADDLEGMRRIRDETGVRVMADESLVTLEDARQLIAERAADVWNVRVGKCGGLLGCARMVALARRHGVECHLGALVGETGILSRAGEIFGRCNPGFECLEGKSQNQFLLEHDIVAPLSSGDSGDARQDAGEAIAGPGLGLELLDDRLSAARIAPPVIASVEQAQIVEHR